MQIDRSVKFWQQIFYYSPASIVAGIWAIYMIAADRFFIFGHYGSLSLTMVFGSFIAGITSEGGGAVAFPVFTKLFHIPPNMARTFGLAIQTVGMGVAAVTILNQKIPIAGKAIVFASVGGLAGIIFGTFVFSPILPAAYNKIIFTVLACGFGVALFMDNRAPKRRRLEELPSLERSDILVLITAGIVGGVFTSIVGTGIDIVTFSILVMLFNLSEKVATPTSVVLMAINSAFGFFLHFFFTDELNSLVLDYWLCCVPVVIFGAPLGAIACAKISRRVLVNILLTLIAVEFATTLLLVQFDVYAKIATPLILIITILFFMRLNMIRERRQQRLRFAQE